MTLASIFFPTENKINACCRRSDIDSKSFTTKIDHLLHVDPEAAKTSLNSASTTDIVVKFSYHCLISRAIKCQRPKCNTMSICLP